ncbi:hypothetical protein EVAR_69347_1 [Eumeta japonica]|uniref:Uncharacterized protein n=1 Tax=Eumeta variegata TaxID=151549 RepID=A0A4C2A3B8_EUMVA|nr:hypothetical protein EVAR_69347_1 [Eumeta japonica]
MAIIDCGIKKKRFGSKLIILPVGEIIRDFSPFPSNEISGRCGRTLWYFSKRPIKLVVSHSKRTNIITLFGGWFLLPANYERIKLFSGPVDCRLTGDLRVCARIPPSPRPCAAPPVRLLRVYASLRR